MSYYGVRKVKQFQNKETGKWNISCEYYDSSLRDWNGNRIWNVCTDGFYRNGFDTKEELEYTLFQDTLDGNIHGTGGKFTCIGWTSDKDVLTPEEKARLKELEERKYNLAFNPELKAVKKRLHEAGVKYEDYEKDPEFRELNNKAVEARKEYEAYRYNTYFNAWKRYLKKQRENKKEARTYIVMVDWEDYTGIYVKTCGSRKTSFTYWEQNAKLFTKTQDELKEMFNGENYRRVSLVDVTDRIVGKGKNRHAEISTVTPIVIKECNKV